MAADKIPAILKEDFSNTLVSWWTNEDIETLKDVLMFTMNLLTVPPVETIKSSLRSLYALGFSTGDNNGNDQLTELGFFLAHRDYSLGDIRYTKALYYASWYGCKDEVAVILSIFNLKKGIADLFSECSNKNLSKKEAKDCQKRQSRFRNPYGDMMAAWYAFLSYADESENQRSFAWNKMMKWAEKNFVRLNEMEKVRKAYAELIYKKKKYPFVLFKESGEEKIKFTKLEDKITYCMLKGFYINLAQKKGNKYINLFPEKKGKETLNDIIKIDRNNGLNFMTKQSKYIIYNQLKKFDTGTKYIDTMAIPEHIVDLLTDFEKEMVGLN